MDRKSTARRAENARERSSSYGVEPGSLLLDTATLEEERERVSILNLDRIPSEAASRNPENKLIDCAQFHSASIALQPSVDRVLPT